VKHYDPRKPLVSIHIPKCGGTSLRQVLTEWYCSSFHSHYYHQRWNLPPRKINLKRGCFSREYKPKMCIHGHFNRKLGIGLEDYYPQVDQFITVLRDLFELHLSNYYYGRKRLQARGGKVYREGQLHPLAQMNWSLADYLRERKESFILQYLPADITEENYQQVIEEKFVAIGLVSRMQESIDMIAEQLDFPPIEVRHMNISARNEDVPPGTREDFIRNNPLVMAIYSYIKEIFPGNI